MGGEPGAIVDQIPAKVGSKLLDYYRNDRKLPRATSETAEASSAQAPTPASEPVEQTVQKQVGLTQPEMSMRGPHDYPTIVTWLKTCEEDIETRTRRSRILEAVLGVRRERMHSN